MMETPKLVVLSGAEAFERAQNLIRSMNHVPSNLNEFGRVMVSLMTLPNSATSEDQANCIQPFLRHFTLRDAEDPGFDERIMYEALLYCAGRFRHAWVAQVPHLNWELYRFNRWLGTDLVLQRC
jgi:hypothetical protein